jgi:hypothetical protein
MSDNPYGAASHPSRDTSRGGIALVILGVITALFAFGLLAGGSVLMWADRTQRDAAGYLTSPTTRLESATSAIAATDLNVAVDAPGWHVATDALGSVRIVATGRSSTPIFIGIAPAADLQSYLDGTAYDQLRGYSMFPGRATYTRHTGGAPTAPDEQHFWRASIAGIGTQSLTWKVESGRWALVLMNIDASSGVSAAVSVGATAPFLFALALGLLIGGGVALAVAVLLLFAGSGMIRRGGGAQSREGWVNPSPVPGYAPSPPPPAFPVPPPAPVPSGAVHALRIEGRLDAAPSRWLWLVKWFLLIPHFIVLACLYMAAVVLTIVAFFTILLTGHYPRSIFDFNVAVLRWSWRVGFYGYSALGTDRYPPFTFGAAADYPATLEVAYPEHLSRGLVLIKWWLLAIPHYLIVALLVGGTTVAVRGAYAASVPYSGLITVLVLLAAVVLLFTKRYPAGIFDLMMGLNRWVYRVLVYVLLLRDEYPPFRLDMGGREPSSMQGAAVTAPPPLTQSWPHPA